MSEEGLKIAEKRRHAKGKGEKKKIYPYECKEIEENNRMGKMRAIFKKTGDTNGPFNAKMGTVKDRNGMGLTETEDIKKRW